MGPLDAEFLFLEDGINQLHIGACAVFDGPTPSFDEFVAMTRSKLPRVPRYRQVVHEVPFGIGRPVWVEAEDFDLDYHVRRVHLPEPGDDEALRRVGGHIMSQPLDRTRPLWESWFVEGLPDGGWAVITKVHHAAIDGVSGAEMMEVLLDLEPDAPIAAVEPWEPEPRPNDTTLAIGAVGGFLGALARQAWSLGSVLVHPGRLLRDLRDDATALVTATSLLDQGASSPLQGPIGPVRRWDWVEVPLADCKTVKDALGGTVNDVLLAAIAGGFRSLLTSLGTAPEEIVVHTLVPVSVRAQDEHGQFNNKVSGMLAELPVHIEHPLLRYEAVRDEMVRLKASHEADATEALLSVAELAPPALVAVASRATIRLIGRLPRLPVATVTTNVPGPQIPLYALGRSLRSYYPYVPIVHGVRVGVAILSYNGRMAFGVTTDDASIPDATPMIDGIRDSAAALLDLATGRASA